MALGAGDNIQIRVDFLGEADATLSNVFYATIEGPTTATTQEIIDAIRDYMVACYNVLMPFVNGLIVGSEITVSRITASGTFIEEGKANLSAVVGGNATNSVPYTTSGNVSFGIEGQGRKGRKSGLPLARTYSTGNFLTSLGVTAYLDWATCFLGLIDITVTLLRFGIYKPLTSSIALYSGSAFVDNVQGTRVTRKVGRGE